ncbi:hypothetical protein ACFQZ1_00045 [Bacillus sp. CGMCC 1.60114]|uniref:hypothetical protein n=1 Tax=unclassified Bacillus (in: firmicutes) TaxID=185979 RepID=UPI00363A04E6
MLKKQEVKKMDVIASRRDFLKHLKDEFTEFRNASKVIEILTSLGYEVLFGKDALDGEYRLGVPSNEVLKTSILRQIQF